MHLLGGSGTIYSVVCSNHICVKKLARRRQQDFLVFWYVFNFFTILYEYRIYLEKLRLT